MKRMCFVRYAWWTIVDGCLVQRANEVQEDGYYRRNENFYTPFPAHSEILECIQCSN